MPITVPSTALTAVHTDAGSVQSKLAADQVQRSISLQVAGAPPVQVTVTCVLLSALASTESSVPTGRYGVVALVVDNAPTTGVPPVLLTAFTV